MRKVKSVVLPSPRLRKSGTHHRRGHGRCTSAFDQGQVPARIHRVVSDDVQGWAKEASPGIGARDRAVSAGDGDVRIPWRFELGLHKGTNDHKGTNEPMSLGTSPKRAAFMSPAKSVDANDSSGSTRKGYKSCSLAGARVESGVGKGIVKGRASPSRTDRRPPKRSSGSSSYALLHGIGSGPRGKSSGGVSADVEGPPQATASTPGGTEGGELPGEEPAPLRPAPEVAEANGLGEVKVSPGEDGCSRGAPAQMSQAVAGASPAKAGTPGGRQDMDMSAFTSSDVDGGDGGEEAATDASGRADKGAGVVAESVASGRGGSSSRAAARSSSSKKPSPGRAVLKRLGSGITANW